MAPMTQADEQWMRLALDLAANGLGQVEPNPAVGCVIVKDGQVIGQGWHQRFGGPHAEIEALADCRAKGHDPAGATMYVTLEPCRHTGKTPPCTQAVIGARIRRVVIAAEDPTPQAGGGIEHLRTAGIEVQVGLCRHQAQTLNAPFFKYARTAMPWVILKWAQSIDAKLAWKNPPAQGAWISNAKSRQDVHQLRNKVQAILTGISTVLTDNPHLTVRLEDDGTTERPPMRVVLDSRLRMPWDCRLISVPDAPTLVVTTRQAAQTESEKVQKLAAAGIEVLAVRQAEQRCDLTDTLAALGQRGVQQLLVEAGPTLLSEFLKQNLADEIRVYIAPLLLAANGSAELSRPLAKLKTACRLKDVHVSTFDDDICISARLAVPNPGPIGDLNIPQEDQDEIG